MNTEHPKDDECWSIAEVAAHLGITEAAARRQLSRWGITGARHYPADQVREAQTSRPGRGNRTPRTAPR